MAPAQLTDRLCPGLRCSGINRGTQGCRGTQRRGYALLARLFWVGMRHFCRCAPNSMEMLPQPHRTQQAGIGSTSQQPSNPADGLERLCVDWEVADDLDPDEANFT